MINRPPGGGSVVGGGGSHGTGPAGDKVARDGDVGQGDTAGTVKDATTETGATAGVAYFGLIDTGMVRNDLLDGTGLEVVLAPLPKWFRKPAPVDDAARALVRGITARARWVYAPGYLPVLLALRTTIALAEPLLARSTRLRAAIRQADAATG